MTDYQESIKRDIIELSKQKDTDYNTLFSKLEKVDHVRFYDNILYVSIYSDTLPYKYGIYFEPSQIYDLVEKHLCKSNNLEKLEIITSNVKKLPQCVSKIKTLEELIILNDSFDTFPEQITELKNLEKLEMRGNNLKNVPDTIANLKKLKHLDLSLNMIEQLPESITELKNLEYLDVSYNRINKLPESIGNLKKLTYINLKGNWFKSIPDRINDLPSLQYLNVSDNVLETMCMLNGDTIKRLSEHKIRNTAGLYYYNNVSLPNHELKMIEECINGNEKQCEAFDKYCKNSNSLQNIF